MRRALLSPLTSAISGVVVLLTISVAIRLDQAEQVVAYGVGMSIGGILGVLIAGGSGLVYLTGSREQQSAVRSFRLRVVLPSVVTTTVPAAVVYASASGIDLLHIAMGCLVSILVLTSEIDGSHLRRQLRTPTLFAVEVSSRVIGLVIVTLAAGFVVGMLVGTVWRSLGLWYFSRDDPSRRGGGRARAAHSMRQSLSPSMYAVSLLYVLLDRLTFLVMPLLVDVVLAAYFVAIMSGQQAVAGAFAAGLQTSLASKAESRTTHGASSVPGWHRRFELMIFVGATAAALFAMVLQAPLLSILSIPSSADVGFIWTLVMVALPAATLARTIQYRLLVDAAPAAAGSILAGVVVLAGGALLSWATGLWQYLVATIVISELMAALAGALLLWLHGHRRR